MFVTSEVFINNITKDRKEVDFFRNREEVHVILGILLNQISSYSVSTVSQKNDGHLKLIIQGCRKRVDKLNMGELEIRTCFCTFQNNGPKIAAIILRGNL